MADWSGRTVGVYQIAEEIGRGGMAVVYRAYQPQLERWVAVKLLRATEAGREEFLARFRREARAIAALRHPNILTIYDYGEEEGVAYIVMEYVPGGTLKDRLAGEPMEWPDVAPLVIAVGEALAYAHSQGVIHRDVKPANILLARPDWPLLADFGLAKLLQTQRGITQPGTSLGTPDYLSPEQGIGEEVDRRSDVYSLGAVLYELLAGEVPLKSDSPVETMLRRLHEPPPPPSRLNPRVGSRLEAVILRALEREPAARYPTMQALVEDLCRLPGATGRPAEPSLEDAAAGGTTARLSKRMSVAGPRLLIASSGFALSIPARDEVLIGRADPHSSQKPDMDLEPYGGAPAGVSRCHARLLCCPEGWLLEDLGSTNGSHLNETHLPPGQPARLRGGDRIRFGNLVLIFHEE
jgi:serine/threonine protein kinase